MKIIQISDTHIRNLKYHDVYRIQFEKIYKKLKELKPDKIVIVGDTMDNFVNITNECKLLTGEFLTNLSNISPLIVTYGNHECMKSNIGRVNSIRTVVELLNNNNIKYLGETCFYEEDDVIWVNYAHLDKGKIDPWDDSNITIPKNINTKPTIGLFHDPIYGSTTDTNMVFNSDNLKHISFFDNNDYLLCGDIHKFQYLRENKTAAYSSSTIQNSHGETPYNHGFIEWNIKSKTEFTSIFHDIKNDYNFINLYINQDFDYININIENKYITEHSTVKVIWKDNTANMNDENKQNILEYIKNKWNIDKVKFEKKPIEINITDVDSVNESIDINNEEEQRKIFKEYLKINKFDDDFIEEVLKIDDIINDKIVIKQSNGVEFTIEQISIDNFKSYDKSEIDFKSMGRNVIIQSQGLNTAGKSTILDSICYLLYGKTLSTVKKEKAGDARFINNKRDLDYATVSGIININGERYSIKRTTTRKWNRDKTELTGAPTVVEYTKIDTNENLNEEQKKDTQLLIENTIGDFDSFINKSFINSENLNDLLSIDRATFIDSLIRDIGLDVFESKLNLIKEYKKELISKRKNINIVELKELIVKLREDRDTLRNESDIIISELIDLEKDIKIKRLEKENNISKLDKIDPNIENLNIIDIELSIDSENDKIQKNKDRLELLVKLKSEIEDYDSSKLDNKQSEIDIINEKITKYKIGLSNYDNEILKVKNEIKHIENNYNNIVLDYTNNLISNNKDYNLEMSKIKESFNSQVNDYTNNINLTLSKINNELTNINNNINNLINDGKKLKTENEQIEGSTICVMCERPLDNVDMTVIHTKVEHNKNEIELLRSQILELRPKSTKLDEQSKELTNIINKLKLKDYTFDTNLFESYEKAKIDIKFYKDKIDSNILIKEEIEKNNYPEDLVKKVSVLSSNIDTHNIKITELENEKKQLDTKLKKRETVLLELKDELKLLKDEKDSIDKKKEKVALEPRIQSEIEKSELNIDKFNKQIQEYNSTLDKIENNKLINKDIKLISDEIDELDTKLKNKNNEKTNNLSTLNNITNKLIEYKEDGIEYNRQKKEDEILNTYLKCVHRDGLPSYIIKMNIGIINQELSRLLCDEEFIIYFDEDLNFKMSPNDRLDIFQPILSGSGKERTLSSICLKISLSKINKNCKIGLLLLDEVMSKLDSNSVVDFNVLLDKIKSEINTVIIIEHNHEVNYDYLISVNKDENGISSLKIS